MKYKLASLSFWQWCKKPGLGLRLDGRLARGDTPFFELPFVALRGIPAMRYQDQVAAMTAADSIDLPWRRDGAMLTAKWLDGSEAKALFRNQAGVITVPLSELKAGSGSWVDAAQRYTGLGVEHILLGIDHLLFVLGLLLIVQGPWMLVKTITSFTIAHSITLGLATLGFVNTLPNRSMPPSRFPSCSWRWRSCTRAKADSDSPTAIPG